jgi:hypothetical protein
MYRDPRADALTRIDVARAERTRTWNEVGGLLEAIDVLRQQLASKGIDPPRAPTIERPDDTRVSLESITLADALRTADAIEKDCARLRTTLQELTTFVTVLGDRALGRHTELPLAAPPRQVPLVYGLAEALPAWLILALPAAGVLAAFFAGAQRATLQGRIVPFVVLALPIAFTTWRAVRRVAFLGRCRVASSVTLEREEDTSTKNTNVPMRFARGWKVSREAYSGYTVRNHLRWMGDDGTSGTLVVRGTPWEQGVVLHDGPNAMCVVDLHSAPRPDHRGEWAPTLATWVWIRLVVVAGLFVALVYGFVASITG